MKSSFQFIVFALSVLLSSNIQASDSACEDLFSAACLGENSKRTRENKLEVFSDEAKLKILEARNKAAQSAGFKDFADQVRSKLTSAGYKIAEPINEQFRSWVEKETELSMNSDVFAENRSCAANTKDFFSPTAILTDKDKITAQTNSLNDFNESISLSINKINSQNLSIYYSQLEAHCEIYSKSIKDKYAKEEDNKEVADTCNKVGEIRRSAIELTRLEGTPEGQEAALQLVSTHPVRNIKFNGMVGGMASPYGGGGMGYGGGLIAPVSGTYGGGLVAPVSGTYGGSGIAPGGPQPQMDQSQLQAQMQMQIEMQKVWIENGNAKMQTTQLCSQLNTVLKQGAEAEFRKILELNSRDKRVVDAVIDSFYKPQTKSRMQSDFDESKSAIIDILNLNISDSELRNRIISTMDDVELFIPKKPTEDMYVEVNGTKVLNTDSIEVSKDSTATLFTNPSLNFFTTANAMYMPRMSVGSTVRSEKVVLMPTLALAGENSPWIVSEIIGHEVGHRIGPKISAVNGFDLSQHYSEILSCYRSPKSIRMRENQADETISDYISSEVIARKVSRLPPAERREAVFKSLEFYCKADNSQHSFNCTEQHPTSTFRVSGIFGANPSIRKMLGCSTESSKYQSCGLKKSILEMPATGTPNLRNLGGSPSERNRSDRGVTPATSTGVQSAK